MDYVGIAHHLVDGDFRGSVNAFRSPLISWLIAGLSFSSNNLLVVGKLVGLSFFATSTCLIYLLVLQLWRSRLTAAVGALWFTLGRGLLPTAVQCVTPDFLLTSVVTLYFLVLLRCLRRNRMTDWVGLGGVHGLAYLAKAIALPWLAVATMIAVLSSDEAWKRKIVRLSAAGLIPLVIACGWGMALRAKYGHFTTGSQFKTNLLQWTIRKGLEPARKHYLLLTDMSAAEDKYMVNDPMPPGSPAWNYKPRLSEVSYGIVHAELRNLLSAIKEVGIVVTPGGMLAAILGLWAISRNRKQFPIEARFVLAVGVSGVCVLLAYCMLVFDSRYIFPLVPLVIAISVPFLIRDEGNGLVLSSNLRRASAALLISGLMFSTVYWASPFRTLKRNDQLSCLAAARELKLHRGSTLVTIGIGPFPEHGVGWEAGYTAAFFSGWRVVAALTSLPDRAMQTNLFSDLKTIKADAIILWGRPVDIRYVAVRDRLAEGRAATEFTIIRDPALGEVGTVLFLSSQGSPISTIQ